MQVALNLEKQHGGPQIPYMPQFHHLSKSFASGNNHIALLNGRTIGNKQVPANRKAAWYSLRPTMTRSMTLDKVAVFLQHRPAPDT